MASCIDPTAADRLPATASTKGVMWPEHGSRRFARRRLPAGPLAARYIEHYWSVRWHMPDRERYRQVIIPHPCLNATVESGSPGEVRHGYPMPQALLHGIPARLFTIDLTGTGRVLGVRFRPGGLTALTGLGAHTLRDRVVPLRRLFGAAADILADRVLAEEDDEPRVALADAFLTERIPSSDPAYEQVLELVAAMLHDRSLVRVDQLTRAFRISARTLQRLFRHYVGASPRWVLARYRLHDAAARLENEPGLPAAVVAADAGYFDQAHFCHEFKALLGVTPAQYAAQCSGPPSPQAISEPPGQPRATGR